VKTSARNQIQGTIQEIKAGQVNSEVVVEIGAGVVLKAVITKEAVEEMGLKAGDSVYAIIKASYVAIAAEKPNKISTRNVLEGSVSEIIEGMVNCELKLAMGSKTLTSMITKEACVDLGIKKGDTVYALIKASSIILAQ